MTTKRFKFDKETVAKNIKIPIIDNGVQLDIGTVLDLLNKLHEENIELKKKLRKKERLIDKIYDDYYNYHGMNLENASWFE